ncbi:Flp pilus assembly protein CpaB [Paenisporosarcina sp. TG20]|uniref:Flp pilus assembly protein CpaB n=1 Tax=Paenisporosarcina sp. TG20 TaxID=1211706 RepID=UPI0002F40841|nr:Flp pilus assembly protein CpaB [Paenisporosarcina sp. TG20]
MNSKRIWIIAMVFGLIAAGMMYVLITDNKNQSTTVKQTTPEVSKEEEKENVEAEEQVEEENIYEYIPVSQGKRAITLEVTDVQGVAGLVRPGSYIDVIAVMQQPEEEQILQHDSATLLLQNVKILSVGHAADDEETMKRYQMITVEVTPKEGLVVSFSSRYELYIMLRQDGDDKIEPDDTHIHENELHEGVFN